MPIARIRFSLNEPKKVKFSSFKLLSLSARRTNLSAYHKVAAQPQIPRTSRRIGPPTGV